MKSNEHGFGEKPLAIGGLNGALMGATAGIGIHGRLAFPKAKGGLSKKRCFAKTHGEDAALGLGKVVFGIGGLGPEPTSLQGPNACSCKGCNGMFKAIARIEGRAWASWGISFGWLEFKARPLASRGDRTKYSCKKVLGAILIGLDLRRIFKEVVCRIRGIKSGE